MPAVTPEIFDRICERLAEGESLRSICRGKDMPGMSSIWKYMKEHDDAARNYARAREAQGDAHYEKVIDYSDLVAAGLMDPQAARVAIDAMKWTAGRMRPKVYGDKFAIGGADDLPPVRTIDASRLSDDALRQILAATHADPETDAG